jgi:hypothetical protein
METTEASETATDPPSTDKLEISAPLAWQFENTQPDTATAELFDPGASTDSAPPLLVEVNPVAPLATVTELLLNVEEVTKTVDKDTLRTYKAPPLPFVEPGRIADANDRAEHSAKLQFKTETVKLKPSDWVSLCSKNMSLSNNDICGDCTRATAPPYTEEEPSELEPGPSVNDTLEQFVNWLSDKSTAELRTVLPPTDVNKLARDPTEFITNAPTMTATPPPSACEIIRWMERERAT